jgi:hypothetical protein
MPVHPDLLIGSARRGEPRDPRPASRAVNDVQRIREAILSRGYAIGPANTVAELIAAIRVMPRRQSSDPLHCETEVGPGPPVGGFCMSDGRSDPDEDEWEDEAKAVADDLPDLRPGPDCAWTGYEFDK